MGNRHLCCLSLLLLLGLASGQVLFQVSNAFDSIMAGTFGC